MQSDEVLIITLKMPEPFQTRHTMLNTYLNKLDGKFKLKALKSMLSISCFTIYLLVQRQGKGTMKYGMFKEVWLYVGPIVGLLIGAFITWQISRAERKAERKEEAKMAMLGHLSILDFLLDDPGDKVRVKLWQEKEFPEFLKSMAQQVPSWQTAVSDLLGLVLRGLMGDCKSLDNAKVACQGISEQIRKEVGLI